LYEAFGQSFFQPSFSISNMTPDRLLEEELIEVQIDEENLPLPQAIHRSDGSDTVSDRQPRQPNIHVLPDGVDQDHISRISSVRLTSVEESAQEL
jgi:hypothetical protein